MPPGCPQRRPDRHLLLSSRGLCEEQAGHIAASDEQHEAHRAKEDQQCRLDIACELFSHLDHGHSPILFVNGIKWLELSGEGVHCHLRLLDADAWFQPSHHFQPVRAALIRFARNQSKRNHKLSFFPKQ